MTTRTITNDDGSTTTLHEPDAAAPGAVELLAALEPAMAAAVLSAAAGFVERAGDLWDAFASMEPTDPGHDAIGVVTDIALTAALPLVADPT